jgi:hypothetical protein
MRTAAASLSCLGSMCFSIARRDLPLDIAIEHSFEFQHRGPVSRRDFMAQPAKHGAPGPALQEAACAVEIGGMVADVEPLWSMNHWLQYRQTLSRALVLRKRDQEPRVILLWKHEGVFGGRGKEVRSGLDHDKNIHSETFAQASANGLGRAGRRTRSATEHRVAAVQKRSDVAEALPLEQHAKRSHRHAIGLADVHAAKQHNELRHLGLLSADIRGSGEAALLA